jgi:hypothetical protein
VGHKFISNGKTQPSFWLATNIEVEKNRKVEGKTKNHAQEEVKT